MRVLLTSRQGFSLTEVLVSLTLVGILIGPLSVGLTSMVSSVRIREELTALSNTARGKMEEVLAMGFDNIPLSSPPGTPNGLSDQVTIGGQAVNRNVIVDLADGDLPPDAIADTGFKKIAIIVGNLELYSYAASKP